MHMKQITIAVNTRMLIRERLDGIGYFAYHTLKRITEAHPEIQFFFIFDRPYDSSFIFSHNITPIIIPPSTTNPLYTYLWNTHYLRTTVQKLHPDLFLAPDGIIPLDSPIKRLSVIHDINFHHYPHDLKFLSSKFYNSYFPRYAKQASRIATVSEYSKNDLANTYNIDPTKIDVVYNGVGPQFKRIDEKTKIETRNTFSKGKEYFIFIGSIHPRKNITRLLRAFELFKKCTGSDTKLLIVGQSFWGNRELTKALAHLTYKTDVVFTGRVDERELNNLLGSALSLVQPSYFEGFSVPLIEAMYAEVPIISSQTTAMPEIAGDAALYFDPFDIEDMSTVLKTISADKKLREQLIEKGIKQRSRFSWDNTAKKLWESIERTLHQ